MQHTVCLSGPALPESFYWFHEPPEFHFDKGLHLHTRGDTDFWQRTHYGFRRDDGHCLFTRVTGDFQMVCHVAFAPCTRYDQCGVMVRVDADHWIKVSMEYENPEISRLGSVVTNGGYSDWATQDVPARVSEKWYRIRRQGTDYIVEQGDNGQYWKQMRITHLHGGAETVEAGMYACSPKGDGFHCHFRTLSLETPDPAPK